MAKITAITPTGSNATRITYETDWKGTPTFTVTDSMSSSFSDYTVTVYAKANADNSTRRHGTFTQPTLAVQVVGIGLADGATLVLPAGDSTNGSITYSYTSDGTQNKSLGSTKQLKTFGLLGHTLSAYYGHGTQTITTMTLTKGDMTFTVILDNPLTINNPSSVNQS